MIEHGRSSRLWSGGALFVALSAGLVGAASCARRIALAPAYAVRGLDELATRMHAASPRVMSYSAEVRLTYMGERGRIRATSSLVAVRPASLRFDVEGPHGAVVRAFATNGVELSALDIAESRFYYGPATPANIDRLLPFAPLGLLAAEWVELLFGIVELPAGAEFTYDDRLGVFVVRWTRHGNTRRVEIDPATARATRAQVWRGDDLVSEVEFGDREAHGLALRLDVRVPAAHAEVELRLRDLELEPEVASGVFALTPPAGVATERLGEGGR